MKLELSFLIFSFSLGSKAQYQPDAPLPPPNFDYTKTNGPAVWNQYHVACGGKSQSPVEISTAALNKTDFPPLVWMNYANVTRNYVLVNNWIGVQLNVASGSGSLEAKIKGGPLKENTEYYLNHVAFRWGPELAGSEHSINNVYYALEAQLVHYKKLATPNLEAALSDPEGLVIISVLFKVDPKQGYLKELEPVINNLKNTVTGGSTKAIGEEKALAWLNKYIHASCSCTKESYYTYPGSLTMPPCTENVIWIVMANPLVIGSAQLVEFQKLKGMSDAIIAENKRPAQQLNARKLQYKAASPEILANWILLIIALCAGNFY